MERWKRFWVGSLGVTAFLIIWEISTPLGLVKVADISRPSLVIKAFFELTSAGEVFPHFIISLKEFIFGFLLSLIVGIPLGVFLGHYRILGLLIDPLLMALYTMPRMAMLPILVVWFGVGLGATIAVVFLGAVFPIIVNTAVGIREIDPTLIRAVRSFGGKELDIFKKVLIPGAVPPMMAGIRLGVGRGILGMVVSEMYASTEGLGGQIALYGNSFRSTELIVLIAIVSLLGFVAVDIIRRIEEHVSRGRGEV